MSLELELIRNVLKLDGLCYRPFVMLAFALIWICPERGYAEVLGSYADFVGDAPERVQAELCRRLLAAGKEIGPEEYLKQVKWEVERDYRIFTE